MSTILRPWLLHVKGGSRQQRYKQERGDKGVSSCIQERDEQNIEESMVKDFFFGMA